MRLTAADVMEAQRELCRRSLAQFVRMAWPTIIPDKLQDNWHIDAVSDHAQASAVGDITRLIITIPPGTSKSTITGPMLSAWLWGPAGRPHHRTIGASHELSIAVRDNRLSRNLITSEWFQQRWPIKIEGDQNEKLHFANEKHGFRQACAISSMTGRRGHTIVCDDVLSAERANSALHRETAIRVMTETIPTRLNDPATSSIIVIMQRLHEKDPAGYLLAQGGWEHLNIPMCFEPERRTYTSIGWTDPRTKDGEVLDPRRFPDSYLDKLRNGGMTAYAWAGQMQQRPAPRGGAYIKGEWFPVVKAAPAECKWVRAWDLAATHDGGDWTVGVLMGRTRDGRYVVADVVRVQEGPAGVRRVIRNTADRDRATWGSVRQELPQDPGQAGKAQAQSLVAELAGHDVGSSPETGSKQARVEPFVAQAEAGNISLVDADWLTVYIDELETFPQGAHDDQIDATSRAFASLAAPLGYDLIAMM